MVEQEFHEAQNVKNKTVVTEAKDELGHGRDALYVLKNRATADGLAMRGAIEGLDRM